MPLGNTTSNSERFKRIIKGYIRQKENLKRFISRDELIGRKGNEKIVIPVPVITIPRFRYGTSDVGGVGQGEGEIGGSAGPDSGDLMDLEIPMSELEELVFEELRLPFIEPKGTHALHTQKSVYNSIAEQGVQKNFKRTYKEALKRTIASGNYQPGDAVVPIRSDFRYRAATNKPELQSSAVLIYMLDVSASMGDEERRLCRLTNSWLQRIIGRYYHNLEERFIVHTTKAHEVEGNVFYGTTLGGGTQASSAFQKSIEILQKDYPSKEWNIYLFYYSDGGNFEEDNDKALALLGNKLLPDINLFCYGECSAPDKQLFMYEMGRRFNLHGNKGSHIPRRKIRMANLLGDDYILETLRTFLTKDNVPFYQTI